MRAFILFVILILSALVLSALINYPLYLLFQDNISSGPHKLINTTGKLIAIPGFIFIIYKLSVADKKSLGYSLAHPKFLMEILRGWATGFTILFLLSAALLILGVRIPDPITEEFGFELAKTAIVALIGGILIGFIEETFFRGGLFSAIRKHNSFLTTLLLSSLFYAWMHFIKPLPLPDGEALGWLSGLSTIAGAFDQFGQWRTFDSFLALFVLGAFFALVRERTGNIAYCIGLHAGFVFVIKTVRKFTYEDKENTFHFLVGHYDGMIGYLSATGLVIHMVLVYHFWRRPVGDNRVQAP